MNIDQLRSDVATKIGYTVRVIDVPEHQCEEKGAGIRAYLCRVNGIYVIDVADTLSKKERNEGEAHELGHIAIVECGLVELDPNLVRDSQLLECAFLIGAINNAISHIHVVELLAKSYGIGSDLFFATLTRQLKELLPKDEECNFINPIMHRLGVTLFDMERILPSTPKDIETKSKLKPEIRRSFELCKKTLARVEPSMSRNDQLKEIHTFLEELGYDPSLLIP